MNTKYAVLELNSDQQDLLTTLSEQCDEGYLLYESVSDNIIDCIVAGDVVTEASMYDVTEAVKKGWQKLVKFFETVIRYLKDKLHGKVNALSLEYEKGEKDSSMSKIIFYSKMNKIKTLEFTNKDKLRFVDMKFVHDKLETLLKDLDKIPFAEAGTEGGQLALTGPIASDSDSYAFGDIRPYVYKDVNGDDFSSIEYNIKNINGFYDKAINKIYGVSKKAIKNAKKYPGGGTYKRYVTAKTLTYAVMNAKRLVTVKEK